MLHSTRGRGSGSGDDRCEKEFLHLSILSVIFVEIKYLPAMKKILPFLLYLAIAFSFSCNKKDQNASSDEDMYRQMRAAGICTDEFVDLGLSVKWSTLPAGSRVPWGTSEIIYSNEMDSYLSSYLRPRGMRYPTAKELDELQNQCRWEHFTITDYKNAFDYNGIKVTGPNGNAMFLDDNIISCTYHGVGDYQNMDEYYYLSVDDYYDDIYVYLNWSFISSVRGVYDDGSPLNHGKWGSGGDSSGSGGGSGTTEPTGGKVSGKIKVYGAGLDYSSYAQSINGNSVIVEWVYYPKTGKYAFYGGAYCRDSSANGGKGVLYDCEKGYNSVEIDSDYASSSGHYREWKYEVYVQFTIP